MEITSQEFFHTDVSLNVLTSKLPEILISQQAKKL